MFRLRKTGLLTTLAMLVVAGSCGDSSSEPQDHVDPAYMRLTIGNTTVTIHKDSTYNGPNIVIPSTGVDVSAVFQTLQGQPVTTGPNHTLAVGTDGTHLTFTRTGPFAGRLNRVQAGSSEVMFALDHNRHPDFRPKYLAVTVQ